MRTRTMLVVLLALAGCDSAKADKEASGTKKTGPVPMKADAEEPGEVDPDEQAALVKNAPPEGEIVEEDDTPAADGGSSEAVTNVHGHEVKLLDGTSTKLEAYKGKALLVVNTASECGYTPQYEDLQTVYAKYKDQGLEVLAFPSNDYGKQEPGNAEEIRKFLDDQYGVQFPVFEKSIVKGDDKIPLYKSLTENSGDGIEGEVKWNFTKFLVDPEGNVIKRFEPKVSPTDPELLAAIEQVLPKGG